VHVFVVTHVFQIVFQLSETQHTPHIVLRTGADDVVDDLSWCTTDWYFSS